MKLNVGAVVVVVDAAGNPNGWTVAVDEVAFGAPKLNDGIVVVSFVPKPVENVLVIVAVVGVPNAKTDAVVVAGVVKVNGDAVVAAVPNENRFVVGAVPVAVLAGVPNRVGFAIDGVPNVNAILNLKIGSHESRKV